MTDLEIITAELQLRDRDRWLACLYAPASARAGLIALFVLDLELAQLVITTTDPMIGEIRLAWWRERLEELDEGKAPAQPLLAALLAHALPVLAGSDLAAIEDRWLGMIGHDSVTDAHVAGGGVLFALAARLLGGDAAHADALGRAWVLGEPPLAATPAPLRLLRGLANLGVRDAAWARAGRPTEPRGSLARQWVLLKAVALGR
ncbi:squalene/phytoene synthase family protein [Sandarakinorhabdus sp.]|uniref:squalene/phytoene synthase family protein n=1 Tax=Sandarakinorhabdus sp. TaxID=1916663 RepID=UPI003340DFF9